MKPIRCFATLIAGISLLAVDGCNLILDNGSPDFVEGWDGTAGAPIAGAADGGQFGSSNGGDVAFEENSAGSGGTAEVDVAGAGAGGTTATPKPVDNGSAVHDEEAGSSNGGSGTAPRGDSGAGGATEPPPPGPLEAPTGVTVTPTSETALRVTWAAVAEALAYEVELAPDANFAEIQKPASPPKSTTTTFSGLNAGKRYYARVRATGSQNPSSVWSSVISGITLLNAPTPSLDLFVNDDDPIRYPGDLLWLEVPPELPASGSGNYYYARGTASATCPPGTTAKYRFDANYDSAARKGYSPWSTTKVAYITAPNSDSRITYYLKARCEGPDINSDESAEIKSCRRRNNDPC